MTASWHYASASSYGKHVSCWIAFQEQQGPVFMQGGDCLIVDLTCFLTHPNAPFPTYPTRQTILDSTGRFGGAGLTQRDTFFATLITEVPASARLLRCFEGETSDEAAVAAGRRALSSRAGSAGSSGSGASGGSGANGGSGLRAGPPGAIGTHVSYGPCPYPELEQFVCSVCCEVRGVVYSMRRGLE